MGVHHEDHSPASYLDTPPSYRGRVPSSSLRDRQDIIIDFIMDEIKLPENTHIHPHLIYDDLEHAETVINASGHTQQLRRNFTLVSLAGIGLVVGSVWPAIGGSILVAIFNGGPPGVLYEFITVSVLYWCVALSIAELASAMPSSAGVYHWASVTPGRGGWGRPIGFLAGWWNYLAWVLGAASMTSIFSNTIMQMYAVLHEGFEAKVWHVFVVYIITTVMACSAVCFANGAMPALNKAGMFAVIAFFIITVVVVTAMPAMSDRAAGHATSAYVWTDWTADIGYPDGFVFVAGMLNGAYSVGAVDAVTHLAEEIPNPSRNVPIALAYQVAIGFVTGLVYLIAILYAISDPDALFDSPYPIAEIYRQATGSGAGAAGLLFLIMVCVGLCALGLHITCSRTLWALARDGAAPMSELLSHLNPESRVPVSSALVSGVLIAALGAIYIGSTTAFNAFVSAFVLLSTSSYLACILPHLLTGRRNIPRRGADDAPVFFRMPDRVGYAVNGIACAYMLVWTVIYSFPYALPTDATSMNYASLIWGGLTILVAAVWFAGARKGYKGPLGVLPDVVSDM